MADMYFDGRVTSAEVTFADGLWETLEVILRGEYEFGTDAHEVIWILSGKLENLSPYHMTRSLSVVVITLRCWQTANLG